ncbi:MAG: methylenetetrahydrofolate reductase [NAD(P)H] [Clostridia bacterium]|nr:methylenetetrahydrofolate reductase [NAD(P)H] [Clostridia bacterium]
MKLSHIFEKRIPTLSFEVFPPKTSGNYESVKFATSEIAKLGPDFMSVTCGAGGKTDVYTADIASSISRDYGVTSIAHMTCVGTSKADAEKRIRELENLGIENVLGLRGDIPEGFDINTCDFRHASELTAFIKSISDICVGGACYPEGHPESANIKEDILHIKEKVEAGCDFLTTQMFFDNHIFYKYLCKLRDAGVNVPVVAGIMPVTNKSQIYRICKLSGTYMPSRFINIVDRFGDDPEAMKQAGIIYATEQIIDLLANGVNAIHVYSMNKPDVAEKIQSNLSHIIPKKDV